MNNVFLALLVGLLAGGVGGYAVYAASSDSGAAGPTEGAAVDLTSLDERLGRIEALLDREAPMTLRGAPGAAMDAEAVAVAVAERLEGQMKDSVRDGVRDVWQEMGAPTSAAAEIPGMTRKRKKAATLAEAAADLGLSSTEENDLREIYEATIERALDLLAGKDGDREEVRRDFERIKTDPNARMMMIGKYMPKIMPNIGEFMTMEMDRENKIREAIGEEKAERLKNEFNVSEADPFGISGNMTIEARGR